MEKPNAVTMDSKHETLSQALEICLQNRGKLGRDQGDSMNAAMIIQAAIDGSKLSTSNRPETVANERFRSNSGGQIGLLNVHCTKSTDLHQLHNEYEKLPFAESNSSFSSSGSFTSSVSNSNTDHMVMNQGHNSSRFQKAALAFAAVLHPAFIDPNLAAQTSANSFSLPQSGSSFTPTSFDFSTDYNTVMNGTPSPLASSSNLALSRPLPDPVYVCSEQQATHNSNSMMTGDDRQMLDDLRAGPDTQHILLSHLAAVSSASQLTVPCNLSDKSADASSSGSSRDPISASSKNHGSAGAGHFSTRTHHNHLTNSSSSATTVTSTTVKKREQRLMKNREAARECRRKKKEYLRCLENRVTILENQNQQLIAELKRMKTLACSAAISANPRVLTPTNLLVEDEGSTTDMKSASPMESASSNNNNNNMISKSQQQFMIDLRSYIAPLDSTTEMLSRRNHE